MTHIVFSDLDGTLLDHHSYSYAPARAALDALKARGIPLVLATSKTAAEVAELHAELDLGQTPAIVENGAGLYLPGAVQDTDGVYERLRAALDELPGDLRQSFQGFGDVEATTVTDWTGLPPAQAERAKMRQHSEPGLWRGSAAELTNFTDALKSHGITARMGGRFLTLSFGQTKADAMARVAADLNATTTIALGDAPNDVEMLEAATRGIIVLNPDATPLPPLKGEETGRILRTNEAGPKGWNTAILDWINTLPTTPSPEPHG